MMKLGGSSSWPYLHEEITSIKRCPCPAVATRTSGVLAEPSSALVLFAPSSSPPALSMISIMEAPAMLEDGHVPQKRRSKCLQVAFYVLIFVLIIVSALVSTVLCLLHHQQAPGSCWAHGSLKEFPRENPEEMVWDWNLQHCDGMVQDQGQYLLIQQSGIYFIYAQLYREKTVKQSLVLMLYKDPEKTVLNKSAGCQNGTINFGRPFSLDKGDKLYCRRNSNVSNIVLMNQTYWGLFKM